MLLVSNSSQLKQGVKALKAQKEIDAVNASSAYLDDLSLSVQEKSALQKTFSVKYDNKIVSGNWS
ncbi:hypothetical protein [Cohnella sp. JJ-181]|uniref:hypothetical protein n=1 Tax=Cohnella rhizoplanae TaxID=2974897 RepID=UPI0022FFC3B1|nr:hypothetical protein [Cohnella sp. JJ-181]CAI6085035.1 hypothetical protein COHCIP112018_04537 [Cohnella sp. JJ-181]